MQREFHLTEKIPPGKGKVVKADEKTDELLTGLSKKQYKTSKDGQKVGTFVYFLSIYKCAIVHKHYSELLPFFV